MAVVDEMLETLELEAAELEAAELGLVEIEILELKTLGLVSLTSPRAVVTAGPISNDPDGT